MVHNFYTFAIVKQATYTLYLSETRLSHVTRLHATLLDLSWSRMSKSYVTHKRCILEKNKPICPSPHPSIEGKLNMETLSGEPNYM